jgi:hypothetical protein
VPAILRKPSLYLARGHPTLRLPTRGLLSRTRLPQPLSILRLIWPAHCHFSMLIRCAMSVTLVLCRVQVTDIAHRTVKIIIISLFISPLLEHRPYLWITHFYHNLLSRTPACFGRHVKPLVRAVFAVVSTHSSSRRVDVSRKNNYRIFITT